MNDLIRRLIAWVSALLAPRTRGRHRARPAPAPPLVRPVAPRSVLPARRSPYGLDVPLDGDAVAMVRPYLLAHEKQQRRRTLVLAADFGIDLDPHVIGARGAA